MEYNSENRRLKNSPPAHLKLKFLRIDAIRLSVLREYTSTETHQNALQKTITFNRPIING